MVLQNVRIDRRDRRDFQPGAAQERFVRHVQLARHQPLLPHVEPFGAADLEDRVARNARQDRLVEGRRAQVIAGHDEQRRGGRFAQVAFVVQEDGKIIPGRTRAVIRDERNRIR